MATEGSLHSHPDVSPSGFLELLVWETAVKGWPPAGAFLFAGPGLLQSGVVRQRDEWSEGYKGGKREAGRGGAGDWVTD